MARKQRIDLGHINAATLEGRSLIGIRDFIFTTQYPDAEWDLEKINTPGMYLIPSTCANVPVPTSTGILKNDRYLSSSADTLLQMFIPSTSQNLVHTAGVRMLMRAKSVTTGEKSVWREFTSTALPTTASLLQQVQSNNDNDMKDNAIKLGGG